MRYQKISPSPRLQQYVRGYYVLEHSSQLSTPFEVKSSVNPTYAFVFNYGDCYQLCNPTVGNETVPSCFLTGISLSNYILRFSGTVGCCGILLWGTAFQNLLPTPPAEELLDRRVDLRVLLGNKADEVTEQIKAASGDQERIMVLEQFMLDLLEKSPNADTPIDHAVDSILRKRGMLSMDELANEVCMSPRQLRRKFKTKVGIGPKTYARLKRFNYINHCLSSNPNLSWKEFINYGGFYDQSHFIKEFMGLSGENPMKYIHQRKSLREQLLRSS
ncbi:helix-turn-helix domain-containing protein [Tunicatimonas pelagia]|uniref:helix-turn-helix domain-containing protein n=1 Tax=Tunicatimonas pelagia TaxID=931531 RepID=UPI002664E781|nr:helix-turn-helix domain-containing protein [Tunicatimonas pelagia]WKN42434.1 helix-turn-helix domain-containing protein [Tunicatimonas pelagia]